MANVQFFRGTQAEYDAKVSQGLISSDAIYYITDKGCLYVGETGTTCDDTGWIPLAFVPSGNMVTLCAAGMNQQIPINNGFAYRVVNGNHVYIAGGFKLTSFNDTETVISAALPLALKPHQPVINSTGTGFSTWQVCNLRWLCPTSNPSTVVTIQLENASRTLRVLGTSGVKTLDFVSVFVDYYLQS